MMKCDLHVHSLHSGQCTTGLLGYFCRESYSSPDEIYARLKRLGMGLVTLTDHDSIAGAEDLRRYPDFFASEEVTCTMPSGTTIHVNVYDLAERQHVELQRRRADLAALLAYLGEQQLLFSLNHVFSSLTGRRREEDFDWLEACFPAIETRNGHLLRANNGYATRLARQRGKIQLGGSDAHTLASAGSAYTEVPRARNKEEFLTGLRCGKGRVRGESGGYWKLTRDVLLVTRELMCERRWALLLAPLVVGIPIVTLLNYFQEIVFARRWGPWVGRRGIWARARLWPAQSAPGQASV
jgi:predicted metal-dependent phosphoesterase TrpH